MGMLIGLGGLPNTGKSHSRTTIKKGEECFIIAASAKATYLTSSKGHIVEDLKVHFPDHTMAETLQKACVNDLITLLDLLLKSNQPLDKIGMKFTGNYYIVNDIVEAEIVLKCVSAYMPHIQNVIFPDFTHFITDKLTSHSFRNRSEKGEAYARYIDLAADAFNAFFKSAKQTRRELLQIIEFHTEFDEIARSYGIFVPGGRMLKEKFLPDSYFDVFLFSHFISEDDSPKLAFGERFKFITRKWKYYDARCLSGMFDPDTELFIPNDLQMIIDKVRHHQGLNKTALPS